MIARAAIIVVMAAASASAGRSDRSVDGDRPSHDRSVSTTSQTGNAATAPQRTPSTRATTTAARPASPSQADRGATDASTTPASASRRAIDALAPEEIEAVIAVAAEISPEWGEGLRQRRARDPEGLRRAIAGAGPRLMGLVTLKRSHPELYALRVEDLRIQSELRALARDYRAKLNAGDSKATEIEAKLRQKVERQVDLDLRASAMELKALDEQLKKLVEQLKVESQQRSERIERVLEEIKAGGEPKTMVRPSRAGDSPVESSEPAASRGTAPREVGEATTTPSASPVPTQPATPRR